MKAGGNSIKMAGSATVIAGLMLTLAACGGGVTGEYYNGDGLLVIDGESVVFTDFTCSESGNTAELDEVRQFIGELTKDGGQVMWDMENQGAYSWTPAPAEPIVENSSGDQITIGDQQFQKSSEEEALETYRQAEC